MLRAQNFRKGHGGWKKKKKGKHGPWKSGREVVVGLI